MIFGCYLLQAGISLAIIRHWLIFSAVERIHLVVYLGVLGCRMLWARSYPARCHRIQIPYAKSSFVSFNICYHHKQAKVRLSGFFMLCRYVRFRHFLAVALRVGMVLGPGTWKITTLALQVGLHTCSPCRMWLAGLALGSSTAFFQMISGQLKPCHAWWFGAGRVAQRQLREITGFRGCNVSVWQHSRHQLWAGASSLRATAPQCHHPGALHMLHMPESCNSFSQAQQHDATLRLCLQVRTMPPRCCNNYLKIACMQQPHAAVLHGCRLLDQDL